MLCLLGGYWLRGGSLWPPSAWGRARAGHSFQNVGFISSGSQQGANSGKTVKVFFAGTLTCEGRERDMPLSNWQIVCRARHFSLSDGTLPSFELPEEFLMAGAPRLSLRVPGWKEVEIEFPPVDSAGEATASAPILLRRERTEVELRMPAGGTDYDIAEITWLRSLDEDPLALPLDRSAAVPLDFKGIKPLAPLPTGIYRVTLKSRSPERIRDFVLRAEMTLRAAPEDRERPPISILLPPSLSRTYIGFAGSASNPQSAEGRTGFFCGVNVNLRRNTGHLLMAFPAMRRDQVLRYADLKPRPDTVWPISNVFLEDPVRMAFDCPLSHADHRIIIHAEDGCVTLTPELIAPDDDRQRMEMLDRMRALIQVQVRSSTQYPEWYDPRYFGLPVQQLPNYDNLTSRDVFNRHLQRLAHTAGKAIEVGAKVTVRQEGESAWDVQVGRIYGEDDR